MEEGKQIRLLEKLPYDFHFRYECEVDGQTFEYRHKLVDWEIGALYRNVHRKHGDNWEATFRAKSRQIGAGFAVKRSDVFAGDDPPLSPSVAADQPDLPA